MIYGHTSEATQTNYSTLGCILYTCVYLRRRKPGTSHSDTIAHCERHKQHRFAEQSVQQRQARALYPHACHGHHAVCKKHHRVHSQVLLGVRTFHIVRCCGTTVTTTFNTSTATIITTTTTAAASTHKHPKFLYSIPM